MLLLLENDETVEVTVELGLGSTPYTPLASIVWTAISDRVLAIPRITSGRLFELDPATPATAELMLDNADRAFEPGYTGSPFYPYLLPLVPLRISYLIGETRFYRFKGHVEGWTPEWHDPDWSELRIVCSDGMEGLANADLVSDYATLTTALAGANNDLTYTADARGPDGNSVSVRYLVAGNNTPLTVSVVGSAITVNVATDGAGAATSTAAQVRDAVNAHVDASALVTAANAAGNNGTGVVAALAATNLTGGTFVQQLAGARVNAVLDKLGVAAADRVVDAGASTIAAQAFDLGAGKALPHLHDIELAELGRLLYDGQGRVVFQGRTYRQSLPVQATFSDEAEIGNGKYPFESPRPMYDKRRIINEATVSTDGAETQTAIDAASQGRYGPRSWSKTLPLSSDAERLALTQEIVRRFAEPSLRVEAITLAMLGGQWPGMAAAVCALEHSDRVRVEKTPPAHEGATPSQISFEGHIEAIEERIPSVNQWEIDLALSPATAGVFLTLDAAGDAGELDTAVLAF